MAETSIEWTERTWNPVVGCTKLSPGCKNCYAETMARRLRAIGTVGYEAPFTTVRMLEARLGDPLKLARPSMYFVNSMSDLFHERVTDDFIDRVFDTMRRAHWHTFQVLTKRADRMAQWSENRVVPPNVWMGTSVEDQKYGVPRITELRKVQAGIRFLSVEPLLEDLGTIDLSEISWVIVGGESGSRARPMDPLWVERIHAQCQAADIAFFFKQWGTFGADGQRRSKGANGRTFRGQVWSEMPVLASM